MSKPAPVREIVCPGCDLKRVERQFRIREWESGMPPLRFKFCDVCRGQGKGKDTVKS